LDTKEIFAKIVDRVNVMTKSSELISPADVDELLLLAAACSEYVPGKFVSVLEAYDKKFDHRTFAREQLAERLGRILKVNRELPDIPATEVKNEELIPTFQLPAKDKTRVLKLCKDMRKIVFSSQVFDEPHKRRLLNRIAAIESQVLQRRGMFDVVRSGISDVGETLGKFGIDVKPLTDRMSEVVGIVRNSTDEYTQLPATDEIKKLPRSKVKIEGD
jgi:hypothetical protein